VPGQRFTIDWNMARKGTFPLHVDRMYPGDDVVDVIGVQQYDCGRRTTEAAWQAAYHERNARTGSPIGLGAWLAYARGKGKPLSVPEWGTGGPTNVCEAEPGLDNPFFIQKMFGFFRDNAPSIAYEAYFNGHGSWGSDRKPSDRNGSHKLAPSRYNPRSAAAYRSLWSSGVTTSPPPPPPPPPSATLSILSASYYGLAAWCDATEAVRAACDGRPSCSVRASDALCGDPEPTVLKKLEVVHACRGEERWVEVAEGAAVSLACR
jgi:hypothetical protein